MSLTGFGGGGWNSGFGGSRAGVNNGGAGRASTTTDNEVDDLFDTKPKPTKPSGPPPEAKLSASFKDQLVEIIQDEKQNANGYLAPVPGTQANKLDEALKDGKIVLATLSGNVKVAFKASKDPERDAESFYYRTTAGFAGTQWFGPFKI